MPMTDTKTRNRVVSICPPTGHEADNDSFSVSSIASPIDGWLVETLHQRIFRGFISKRERLNSIMERVPNNDSDRDLKKTLPTIDRSLKTVVSLNLQPQTTSTM